MMPRQSPFAVLFDRFFSANGFYLTRDDLTSSYAIIRHNIRTFRSAGVLAVVKGRHKAESELKKFEGKRVGNRILDWRGIIDAVQPRPQGSVRRRAESQHQPNRAARRGDNRGLGS